VSTALLLSGPAVALTWTVVAVVVSGLGLRTGRITLNSHAAVYVVAAAAASGLLAAASAALAAPAGAAWPAMGRVAVAVLMGAAACWAIPMSPAAALSPIGRMPRLAIAIVLVWSAAGWLVGLVAAALLHAPNPGLDAGALATVRTSVLAAAALALAWAGRSARWRESGWLLYPVLALGGLKLLVEDLPRSQPATLFIALAAYGGALIVAPRLARARSSGVPHYNAPT